MATTTSIPGAVVMCIIARLQRIMYLLWLRIMLAWIAIVSFVLDLVSCPTPLSIEPVRTENVLDLRPGP